MPLSADDINALLYNQGRNRRFTQDSPVLPDVWAQFAEQPGKRADLLLTPYQGRDAASRSPAHLASVLHGLLQSETGRAKTFHTSELIEHQIAVNQTTVAVKLSFDELVRVVLPLSAWWQLHLTRAKADDSSRQNASYAFNEMRTTAGRKRLAAIFSQASDGRPPEMDADFHWLMLVVGVIALANDMGKRTKKPRRDAWPIPDDQPNRRKYFKAMFDSLADLFAEVDLRQSTPPLVFLVNRNRPAMASLYRSIPAVKADAAVNLFRIDCSDITWAVVDSGIDARHPAFRRRTADGNLRPLDAAAAWQGDSRVAATYDFTIVRRLLSTEQDDAAPLPPELKRVLKRNPGKRKEIRERLINGREIDWPLLLTFLEVPHDENYVAPEHDHGTHVAGIMAADWHPGDDDEGHLDTSLVGMCPGINLLDIRILDKLGHGDEFSVMAALQFLRYLNSHKDHMVVHGANLSLSILHDVANYACGRTPVCEESERLVSSGVVVVAAAGNDGFERMMDGPRMGDYRSISITDPGNAAGVITVGATHRDMPHTYGVSYFSSRGPTGDGRLKPDLVAPGEKIDSTAPNKGIVRKDGTSMAAPHVSGAAALLIARHREFLGQPNRVKTVLCRSATDLGRERYFQGCGMLDVLRALQEV
jgi:serine protease AprX